MTSLCTFLLVNLLTFISQVHSEDTCRSLARDCYRSCRNDLSVTCLAECLCDESDADECSDILRRCNRRCVGRGLGCRRRCFCDQQPEDDTCCDPVTRPDFCVGLGQVTCCPDGTWGCSNPLLGQVACEGDIQLNDDCDSDDQPLCTDGAFCCPDGTWTCGIGNGDFPCSDGTYSAAGGRICSCEEAEQELVCCREGLVTGNEYNSLCEARVAGEDVSQCSLVFDPNVVCVQALVCCGTTTYPNPCQVPCNVEGKCSFDLTNCLDDVPE